MQDIWGHLWRCLCLPPCPFQCCKHQDVLWHSLKPSCISFCLWIKKNNRINISNRRLTLLNILEMYCTGSSPVVIYLSSLYLFYDTLGTFQKFSSLCVLRDHFICSFIILRSVYNVSTFNELCFEETALCMHASSSAVFLSCRFDSGMWSATDKRRREIWPRPQHLLKKNFSTLKYTSYIVIIHTIVL